jgi:hypothetical protein
MRKNRVVLLPILLLAFITFAFAPRLVADTIASNTAGTIQSLAVVYFGQSFTTGAAGPYDDIVFNFYQVPNNNPYAEGTGFLLSTAYSGSPAGLNSSTPGFLGSTVASGGFYNFSPSLTLLANTQYFFYENAALASIRGFNVYSGGNYYYDVADNPTFLNGAPASTNFTVTGDPVAAATPEPSSLVLFATGVLGVAAMSNRKLLFRSSRLCGNFGSTPTP